MGHPPVLSCVQTIGMTSTKKLLSGNTYYTYAALTIATVERVFDVSSERMSSTTAVCVGLCLRGNKVFVA